MVFGPIDRPTIADVVGGGEESHFNPACAAEIDRIVGPVIGIDVEDVQREVPCGGRRLDLLATSTGRRVAIELQYGEADPSHLGRLIGWYAPHVSATDHVLVAESFPRSVTSAVRTGRIPNTALVRAVAGWNSDGTKGIDFEVVESNIDRLRGSPDEAHARSSRARASIVLLESALAEHGLKDSNARDYVRLFPVHQGCWAMASMRATRVVVGIGSYHVFDAELAAELLGDDWDAKRNGVYNTMSTEVDSFTITEDQAAEIAVRIAASSEMFAAAVETVAGTIIHEDEDLD